MMKLSIISIMAAALLFGTDSAFASDTKVLTGEVVYYKDGKEVRGYFARPADNQKHPGLILIHEWWGLNDNIRGNAKRFAMLGYAALAVDLYDGKSAANPGEARKLATHVRGNMDEAFKNLKSAFSFIKGHPNVNAERVQVSIMTPHFSQL